MKVKIEGLQLLDAEAVVEVIESHDLDGLLCYGIDRELSRDCTLSNTQESRDEAKEVSGLLRAMLVSDMPYGISLMGQKLFLAKTANDLIPELENMDADERIYIELSETDEAPLLSLHYQTWTKIDGVYYTERGMKFGKNYALKVSQESVSVFEVVNGNDHFIDKWMFLDNPTVLMNLLEQWMDATTYNISLLFDDIMNIHNSK